jgi:inosine-uridine nucleoside N-ribohydrolase
VDPGIDLVAATTVAGNAEIVHTTRNTLTVLEWFGATEVPVYRGASRPLARPLVTIPQFQGTTAWATLDWIGASGSQKRRAAQRRSFAWRGAGGARSRSCAPVHSPTWRSP